MKYFKFFLFSALFAMAISACGEGAEHSHDGDATEQHDSTDSDAANHHDADGHGHDSDAGHTDAAPHGNGAQFTSAYVCPMHCEGSGSEQAGKCPKCKMDYVVNAEHVKDGHKH